MSHHHHRAPAPAAGEPKNPHFSRNILIAFILNLVFSIYEFIGGTLTHSVAIVSDSIHDLGDAISIGISYFLERKSHQRPDAQHSYGYIRYSLVGGLITTTILLVGSVVVITGAIQRVMEPVDINYDGMILLAVIGVVVNFAAAYLTSKGDSLNQKSVNLHMLEDVLGWVVVLIGAVVMRFTNFSLLDPILSILVALYILKEALSNLFSILGVFVEKTPDDTSLSDLRTQLLRLPHVRDVHHLHVWSMDGFHNYATLHIVTDRPSAQVKADARRLLADANIEHVTIELETPREHCAEPLCHGLAEDPESA